MSTEAVYSQALLVNERREIRILVLAPGTGNDVLRGELAVESLDYHDLHYTALSYTSSGSVGEHYITIGGAPLYIYGESEHGSSSYSRTHSSKEYVA